MANPVTTPMSRGFDDSTTTVAVNTVLANAAVVEFNKHAGGSVSVPAASSLTTLTFYACHTRTGTFVPLYDANNVAVTLTVAASRVVALPDALFGVPYFKMVGNANGTVTIFKKG
jgi:hypothetical protein